MILVIDEVLQEARRVDDGDHWLNKLKVVSDKFVGSSFGKKSKASL